MAHQLAPPELADDLERGDDLPIGAQLAWRLRVLIESGKLAAGDRLPGVRELARGSGVNVNTARAVYRRLEDEGLIASRHGLGTFVSEDASSSPDLERLAAEAAARARASGVDPRDLGRAIYAGSGATAEPPAIGPLDTAVDERPGRRELRRQIGRLEAELAFYPAEARRTGEPTHPLLRPKGHVPDLSELEAIRDELVERLKRAHRLAEDRGKGQGRARTQLEAMIDDPPAHKRETVSQQDLGEPGCASWEVEPRWGPVGALMNWWRVRISSGCP